MKRIAFTFVIIAAAVAVALAADLDQDQAGGKPAKMLGKGSDWSMNATIIEACSCPMFCSCYFGSGHPAGHYNTETHAEEYFCRFNKAIRVNKGHYGAVALDGAKFWVAGNLGSAWSTTATPPPDGSTTATPPPDGYVPERTEPPSTPGGTGTGKGSHSEGTAVAPQPGSEMAWAVVTFDKSLTEAQRNGIAAIVAKLYPLKFGSLTTAEGDMSWNAGQGEAHAMLDGGKTAEVALKNGGFGIAGRVPVIKDLQYWGANHNDGFLLMPNTVEAYRVGDKPFEFKNTSGFMITFDIKGMVEAGVTGDGDK